MKKTWTLYFMKKILVFFTYSGVYIYKCAYVLLTKLIVAQVSKNYSTFYGNSKILYRVNKSLSLNQLNHPHKLFT
jgi:hypothetical protein